MPIWGCCAPRAPAHSATGPGAPTPGLAPLLLQGAASFGARLLPLLTAPPPAPGAGPGHGRHCCPRGQGADLRHERLPLGQGEGTAGQGCGRQGNSPRGRGWPAGRCQSRGAGEVLVRPLGRQVTSQPWSWCLGSGLLGGWTRGLTTPAACWVDPNPHLPQPCPCQLVAQRQPQVKEPWALLPPPGFPWGVSCPGSTPVFAPPAPHRRCSRSASATLTCTRFCRATAPPPTGCCRSCSTWWVQWAGAARTEAGPPGGRLSTWGAVTMAVADHVSLGEAAGGPNLLHLASPRFSWA